MGRASRLVPVAKYVARSTIQMTMRYPHLMPGANHEAANLMNAFHAGTSAAANGTATRTATTGISTIP